MWKRFVAIGDSVTEGVGDSINGIPCKSWATHVYDDLKRINPTIEYTNLAIRGQTSEDIRKTQLNEGVKLNPDLVSVIAGGNDVLKGKWNPEMFEEHYRSMIEQFAISCKTIISTTAPDFPLLQHLEREKASAIRRQLQELNELIRKNCRDFNVHLVDLWHVPFTLDMNGWSKDGIHPNSKGYILMAKEIKKSLSI